MAPDFLAAFGLSPDDKNIATVDAEIHGLRPSLTELKALLQSQAH